MGNWKLFNPNPTKNRVGDCTIRALSKALGQDWKTTYAALSAYGYSLGDMPNANWVWGMYLEDKGYQQYIIDHHGKRIYTVDDFCQDNPQGTFILAIDGHVVCVKDGKYYDSWDSGAEIPIYYWMKN